MREIEIISPETGEIKKVELPMTAAELITFHNWELLDVDIMADFSHVDLNNLNMTLEQTNQLDSIIDEVEEWDYTADDLINLYDECMGSVTSYENLLEALSPCYLEYYSANSLSEYAENHLNDNYSLPDDLMYHIDLEGYGETLLEGVDYTYVESGGMITCEGWEYTRYSIPTPLTEYLNKIEDYIEKHGFIYVINDTFGYYDTFTATLEQTNFIKKLRPGCQETKIYSLKDLLKDEDAINSLEVDTLEEMAEYFVYDIINQE